MKVYIHKKFFDGEINDKNLEKYVKEKYDKRISRVFMRRLRDARALPSLHSALKPGFPGRWEILREDRKNEISARLDGGRRLIFVPNGGGIGDFVNKDNNFDAKLITEIVVIDITNYH